MSEHIAPQPDVAPPALALVAAAGAPTGHHHSTGATLRRSTDGAAKTRSIPTCVHGEDQISKAGVVSQLRAQPDVKLVAEDGLSDATVVVVVADRVDESTVQVLHRFRRRGCRLVLVATVVDDLTLMAAAEAGVEGLVRRADATADGLVTVIQRVWAGDGAIPPDVAGRLLQHVGRLQRQVLSSEGILCTGLTARETELLKLVADGDDTAEIATKLCYSQRTIKNILSTLMMRMHLRNRTHAVAYALREGLI